METQKKLLQEKKRKKRKENEQKAKLRERLRLKMIIPDDKGVEQLDEELFSLTKIRSGKVYKRIHIQKK